MPTQYVVFPEVELLYSTDANYNTPLTAPTICIDRTKQSCIDYQYGLVYATHSKTSGLMVRTPPSSLVKTGWLVELTLEHPSLGQKSYRISKKLTSPFDNSAAIYVSQQEMFNLVPGTWEIYAILTPVPPTVPNQTVYVTLTKFQQVVI